MGHKRVAKGDLCFRVFLADRPMSKDFRRTVLYEVIKQKYGKLPVSKKLGRSNSAESRESGYSEETAEASSAKQEKGTVKVWPVSQTFGPLARKRGLSIRYPIAGLLALAVVLGVLGAFKLRQLYGPKEKQLPTPKVRAGENYVDSSVLSRQKVSTDLAATDEESAPARGAVGEELLRPAGDHVIVIATYKQNEDLVPVKEYFDQNGIETDIQERGDYYFLVTKDKFQSPRRAGTDGNTALQRIRRVGADYKAPQGYESFAPNLFQDAYGMKIR